VISRIVTNIRRSVNRRSTAGDYRRWRHIWSDGNYCRADITQPYDPMNDRFGESKIELRKDIATPCLEPTK
jgi:hypothetical protein